MAKRKYCSEYCYCDQCIEMDEEKIYGDESENEEITPEPVPKKQKTKNSDFGQFKF